MATPHPAFIAAITARTPFDRESESLLPTAVLLRTSLLLILSRAGGSSALLVDQLLDVVGCIATPETA